jgi:hypothetical protein
MSRPSAERGPDATGGVTRRTLMAGAGAAAGGAALAAPGGAAAQAGAGTVGVPRNGTNAIELVGAIVQDGVNLTSFGYLTRISGLRQRLLFTGSDRSEGNARFTFLSNVEIVSRSVRNNVFSVTALGDVDFYFDESGGGDFGQPQTFAEGTRIAGSEARFHNVLTVIAPDRAVLALHGELLQRSVRSFRLGGAPHRLGRRRLRQRLFATGEGRRTDAATPRADFDVAGHLVLAG